MPGRGKDVSDDEIIAVLKSKPDPVLSTREIVDELPINKRRAVDRLKELRDRGKIQGKRIGRGFGWWLPERIADYEIGQ